MHVTNSASRIREFLGLMLLVAVALAAGLLLERASSSVHARWIAAGTVLGFMGLAVGVVRLMSSRAAFAINVIGVLTPAAAIMVLRGLDAPVTRSVGDAVLLVLSLLAGVATGFVARWVERRQSV